jgi:hypothetical protein
MKELPDFALCCRQRLPTQWSGPVHSPERFSVAVLGRSQIAFFLQSLKKGIETAWTDAVSVTCQFLDQSQSENWTFDGVM